jgi:hypothetical protein
VLVILRARGEKAPNGLVLLIVPELRQLLTHLLWRGWTRHSVVWLRMRLAD